MDALRCLQWLLWLACLSVLDYHSLDSVGQELISRERHEHSHSSGGGHNRHLILGHGGRLRVSTMNALPLSAPFTIPVLLFTFLNMTFNLVFVSSWSPKLSTSFSAVDIISYPLVVLFTSTWNILYGFPRFPWSLRLLCLYNKPSKMTEAPLFSLFTLKVWGHFFSFFHIYSLTFTMLAGLEKDILVQLLVLLNCPLLWTIQSRCWLDVYLAFSVNKLNKYGQCART